jgi:hypothetical protein
MARGFDHRQFTDLGMPEALAAALATQIAGKWITEDVTPNAMVLIRAGCIPSIADDLVAGIMCGRVHPGELSTLTGWPRELGERINAILDHLSVMRERRIAECQRFQNGAAA